MPMQGAEEEHKRAAVNIGGIAGRVAERMGRDEGSAPAQRAGTKQRRGGTAANSSSGTV